MEKMEIIKCGRCGTDFPFSARAIKYRRKIDPATKFYCSKECRFTSPNVDVPCDNCGAIFNRKSWELKDGKKNFCSHKCSATVTNSERKLEKGRKKIFYCNSCNTEQKISMNAKLICRNKSCKDFIPTKEMIERSKKELICIKCNQTFIAIKSKYCDLCRAEKQKENGNKSVLKQNRRSKNEIYFAELCEKHFFNVKKNEPQFNKWDADVILDDFKVAVLWNGNWHYQEISKKISLAQVQARDKIKVREIIKCGYYPYIIEDRGKYNKEFVEKQFEIFLEYIKNMM